MPPPTKDEMARTFAAAFADIIDHAVRFTHSAASGDVFLIAIQMREDGLAVAAVTSKTGLYQAAYDALVFKLDEDFFSKKGGTA